MFPGGAEMARASRSAVLCSAVLLLCGCGTVSNLSTGARQGWRYASIYGGVRRDIQSERDWIAHSWTSGKDLDVIQDIGTVVGAVIVGVDVPISAIGDTLTLPLTVPVAIWSNAVNRANVSRNPAPAVDLPPATVPVNEPTIMNPPAGMTNPTSNAAGSPYSANRPR